jgi:hypothetical protein
MTTYTQVTADRDANNGMVLQLELAQDERIACSG